MASHLTPEERDRIAQLWHQGADQKQIAEAIGRSPATISRELRRNGSGQEYYAGQAQQEAGRRRREHPLVRKLDDPQINQFVRAGLAREWAPEQIEGRLKQLDADGCARSQTIYTWIKQDAHRQHWEARLRRRGKRPRQRKNTATTGDAARIEDRPEVIEKRIRLGDFEGDTVLGPAGTGGLATLVDRKSRFTIVVKIHSKKADHVHEKLKGRLKEFARRTPTLDHVRQRHRVRALLPIGKAPRHAAILC